MIVRHFMSRNPVTVKDSDLCSDTHELFLSKKLRRAPVLRGD